MKTKTIALLSAMAIMSTSTINLTTTKADIVVTTSIGLSNETHAQKVKDAQKQVRLAKKHVSNAKGKQAKQMAKQELKQAKHRLKKLENKTSSKNNNQAGQTSTSTQDQINQAIQAGLNQINLERQQRGVGPYTINPTLASIANQRAQQISTNFGHYDSNGNGLFSELMEQQGYQASESAENIGQDLPNKNLSKSVLNDIHEMMYNDAASDWGHRDNFLDSSMNQIGIGIYVNSQGVPYIAYDMSGN